jgi:hypothetical protein
MINIFQVKDFDENLLDYVSIDHGNGEFTSMPKATYEATLVTESAPTA